MAKVEPGEVYTLREAAEYLKVSYSTMLRWVKQSTFPAFKIGRFWRIYGRDLLTLDKLGESEEE
ncbi:MAG: helix-turn-helix domain-containing protein [Anaerolineales bacterium]|nr:helix-turn-helix domain-containing protein [Anaerolineales bacterium]